MALFEGLDINLPGVIGFDVESLVDDSLINTCTLFDESHSSSVLQMQKTKQTSPFHESDSGVSEMSEVGENTCLESDLPMLDEMLNNETGPFLSGRSESDLSVFQDMDFFSGDRIRSCEQNECVPGDNNTQTCRRETRWRPPALGRENTRSDVRRRKATGSRSVDTNTKTIAAKKLHRDSESDESEIDVVDSITYNSSAQRPRGSVKVKQAGEKLPTSRSTNPDKCNVTSVKVLRIVKSGDDSNTEDDVVKALEERNRKNAEMARQNRLKKKAYVGNLEQEVEDGRKRIHELASALNDAEEERDGYKREVEYLKSVLANQSALAGLLKNIPNVSGVTLSSSVSRKRVAELDHSYTPVKKGRHAEHPTRRSGVCLHVDSNNVSLEFCHHCAEMACGKSS
ncbi:uncharacterized protein LOC143290524 [Babylonia areolata]|uniref:uncharacterized protein LOC143290524 n=1 Tax=Babylonia areolata TaxID=304850 RepID=UPI003FD30F4B